MKDFPSFLPTLWCPLFAGTGRRTKFVALNRAGRMWIGKVTELSLGRDVINDVVDDGVRGQRAANVAGTGPA